MERTGLFAIFLRNVTESNGVSLNTVKKIVQGNADIAEMCNQKKEHNTAAVPIQKRPAAQVKTDIERAGGVPRPLCFNPS